MNRVLPDCLFVGPQKAGTSWIYEYLLARSDVCLPRGVKETFFFDDRFDRKDLKWYTDHFSHFESSHHRVTEVAPTYFQHPFAAARIFETVGRIPIVVTLREPVARSYSLYTHLRRYGITNKSLRDACEDHPEIISSSNYVEHLMRWLSVFGVENVLVLLQEDMVKDSRGYIERVNEFIGLPNRTINFDFDKRVNEAAVPASSVVASLARRSGDLLRDYRLYWPIETAKKFGLKALVFGRPGKSKIPKISDEDRDWLQGQLDTDRNQLKDMLNRDLAEWCS